MTIWNSSRTTKQRSRKSMKSPKRIRRKSSSWRMITTKWKIRSSSLEWRGISWRVSWDSLKSIRWVGKTIKVKNRFWRKRFLSWSCNLRSFLKNTIRLWFRKKILILNSTRWLKKFENMLKCITWSWWERCRASLSSCSRNRPNYTSLCRIQRWSHRR